MSLCATWVPPLVGCQPINDRPHLGILLNTEPPLMRLLRETKSRQTQRNDMEGRLALRTLCEQRRHLAHLKEAAGP